MNKGVIFSFEALISLILFALILISFPIIQETSFRDLIAIQQANDLLKVWSYDFKINEMKSDIEFVFNKNATLIIDNQIIYESPFLGERISVNGIILDDFLNERNIQIIIYFN